VKRAAAAAILLAALAASAVGCGSTPVPDMQMMTAVWWNRDPSALGEIGYEVLVDFGWMDRAKDCFPLSPNLKLQVNDREVAPTAAGLCEWDILVRLKGFVQDEPLNIRVSDGDRVLGTALFTGMFPGASAQLISPVGGAVHAGEKIVVSIPSGVVPRAADLFGADFYWRDTPAGVPPFYSFSPAAAGADGGTVETTAPMQTGRAALAIETLYSDSFVSAQTCEGFTNCYGQPNFDTLGPISIEVVP